ncbi:MAG: HlyD family type I secretion periplasmic adaptor subunit, partial [Chromatiales bacterium]
MTSDLVLSGPDDRPAYEARGVVLAGILVIFLTFAGFGTWAALAPLSGAIIAAGVVKVDTNRKTVQHLEGGIVKDIRVRDGDRVEAGQTLIVIEDEQVSAGLDLLQGQLDAELAKAARLQAERDGHAAIAFPQRLTGRAEHPEVRELLRSERTFFSAKHSALDAQVALLEELIARVQQEIAGLTGQVEAEDAAIGLLRQEIAANEELQKKNYVEETRLLTLRRQVQEYQARRGEHLADIAAARQKITGHELRIASLRDEYLQTAADELTASQAKIFDLEE